MIANKHAFFFFIFTKIVHLGIIGLIAVRHVPILSMGTHVIVHVHATKLSVIFRMGAEQASKVR